MNVQKFSTMNVSKCQATIPVLISRFETWRSAYLVFRNYRTLSITVKSQACIAKCTPSETYSTLIIPAFKETIWVFSDLYSRCLWTGEWCLEFLRIVMHKRCLAIRLHAFPLSCNRRHFYANVPQVCGTLSTTNGSGTPLHPWDLEPTTQHGWTESASHFTRAGVFQGPSRSSLIFSKRQNAWSIFGSWWYSANDGWRMCRCRCASPMHLIPSTVPKAFVSHKSQTVWLTHANWLAANVPYERVWSMRQSTKRPRY